MSENFVLWYLGLTVAYIVIGGITQRIRSAQAMNYRFTADSTLGYNDLEQLIIRTLKGKNSLAKITGTLHNGVIQREIRRIFPNSGSEATIVVTISSDEEGWLVTGQLTDGYVQTQLGVIANPFPGMQAPIAARKILQQLEEALQPQTQITTTADEPQVAA